MSKVDALLTGLERVITVDGDFADTLQPGWFDVVENALAQGGYYLAPIRRGADHPAARNTDPRTSHNAAKVAYTLKAGSQRYLLLGAYANTNRDGLTDEEAMESTVGVRPESEYAKRCSELRHAGWIEDTGEERPGNSGVPRIVCAITEAGRVAYRATVGSW